MMPTASCLHYATQCFEGMKVYRGFDGKLRLFRPEKNCSRLVMSSQRVVLPAFNPKELEKLLLAFMAIDGPRKLSLSCKRSDTSQKVNDMYQVGCPNPVQEHSSMFVRRSLGMERNWELLLLRKHYFL